MVLIFRVVSANTHVNSNVNNIPKYTHVYLDFKYAAVCAFTLVKWTAGMSNRKNDPMPVNNTLVTTESSNE